MRKAMLAVAVAAMVFMFAPSALAGPIINVGSEMGGTAVLHAPGTLGDGLNVYVGAMAVTGQLGTFETYCVDLQHYITLPGTFEVNPLDQMSNWTMARGTAGGGPQAAWLYNTYWQSAAASGNGARAALQLAIWEVLFDSNHNVLTQGDSGAGFWVDQSAAALAANVLLNGMPSSGFGDASWLRIPDVANNYTQDLIGPAIPEPTSMLLLGTGLIGLGARFRRRRR